MSRQQTFVSITSNLQSLSRETSFTVLLLISCQQIFVSIIFGIAQPVYNVHICSQQNWLLQLLTAVIFKFVYGMQNYNSSYMIHSPDTYKYFFIAAATGSPLSSNMELSISILWLSKQHASVLPPIRFFFSSSKSLSICRYSTNIP